MRQFEQHLEPRVSRVEAKVESALEAINALTTNIQNLSSAVQRQGEDSVAWREKLMLAVERAGAPRRTDWHLMATLVGLILAVGALAFTPLNWRINEVQKDADRLDTLFSDHGKLTLHPVGASKVEAMEHSLGVSSHRNSEAIQNLDTKLQREFALVNARIDEKVDNLAKQFEEVKKEGSPITRERLAVLESMLKDLLKHYDAVHPAKAQP